MRRRPDSELITLAREGSAEAAGVLFDRYWDHALAGRLRRHRRPRAC